MPEKKYDTFEQEVVRKWLQGLLPEIIQRGGDEKMILALTELLVVGTLHVCRSTYGVEPHMAFERMKKAIDQRLDDMEGQQAHDKKILLGVSYGQGD